MELADRTLFVTGGARGIGLATAKAFARRGAKVVITDINEAALEEARRELAQIGPVREYLLDVRDRAAFTSAVDQAERELGEVEILFNNAGVAGGAHVKRMSYEYWDWVLGINLGGVINGLQTVLPRMLGRGGGYIINTASISGIIAGRSNYMYNTSKFAVVGLSEGLAVELAPYGVGVSVLCPGNVNTDILRTTRETIPGKPSFVADVSAEEKTAHQRNVQAKFDRLSKGVSPEYVGELVLQAVLDRRIHIFTDAEARALISERDSRLLAALDIAEAASGAVRLERQGG